MSLTPSIMIHVQVSKPRTLVDMTRLQQFEFSLLHQPFVPNPTRARAFKKSSS